MTQVTKIPDWWRETTNKGVNCIEKNYSWYAVSALFRYYPHDESLSMHLYKFDTTIIFTNQSKILEHEDIETYCRKLISEKYQEIMKKKRYS